jgi:hypothetical protein
MTLKNPGTRIRSLWRSGSTPILGERVLPWGRRIKISSFWAPIGQSGGYPGDEITKKGAHCFRETPNCCQIAGFVGLACSKKGPNRPNWRGDNSLNGLLDVEMTEPGYGDPVRNVSTRETLMIGTLTRRTSPPHSPTWEPRTYPVGRQQQVPDPAIFGDEIAKMGAYCFQKTPNCRPIAGLWGLACPKKGPNRPNWEGDNSSHGLLDVKPGKPGSGDPSQNPPNFTGTGDTQKESMNDRKGRNPT